MRKFANMSVSMLSGNEASALKDVSLGTQTMKALALASKFLHFLEPDLRTTQ
jgi:hypothetical protein